MKRAIGLLLVLVGCHDSPAEGPPQPQPDAGPIVQPLPLPPPPTSPTAIELENQKPGDSGWRTTTSSTGFGAYTDAVSYLPGDTVMVRAALTGGAGSATWGVWRIGYYGGAGGRRILSGGPTAVAAASPAVMDPASGAVTAPWETTFTFRVPDDAVTGVYVVKLTTPALQTCALFVVREPKKSATILYPVAVNTYQAYNDWGDISLYVNRRHDWLPAHGYVASFDRPYAYARGMGLFLYYDYELVYFVEAQGYDLAYATDVDMDADPSLAQGRRMLVIQGHAEYWSANMRAAVEGATAAGIHTAFFGANLCYWQVRYAPSADGRPRRQLVGYKEYAAADPLMGTDPAHVTTQWRDAPVLRPEDRMIGEMYGDDWLWTASALSVSNPGAWIWTGAGIDANTLIPGIYGVESDRMNVPGGAPPAGVTELARSVIENHNAVGSVAQTSFREAPSGAWVFAAGSLGWSPMLARAGLWDRRIQIATANVFARMDLDAAPGAANLRVMALPAGRAAPVQRPGVTVSTITAALSAPAAVTVAPDGSAVVVDGNRVVRVTLDGQITPVAGDGFQGPRGIAAAADGTIYVADTGNYQVKKISPAGAVTVVAGGRIGFADGPGATAQFSQPSGMARLADGTLIVADTWNQRVRAIAPDGTVSTWVGNGSANVVNGPGAAAQTYFPFGVAARADGSVVLLEADTGVVRVIAPDAAHTVSVLAGDTDRAGWDDGALATASVHEIIGVAAGRGGDVILLDGASYRVRLLSGSGIDTLAGGTTSGLVDGAGAGAGFALPRAAALLGDGSYLVVDLGNHALRRIIVP